MMNLPTAYTIYMTTTFLNDHQFMLPIFVENRSVDHQQNSKD